LFQTAARNVFEQVHPNRLAAYLAYKEPSESLDLARRIIAGELEKEDKIICATHALIGRNLVLYNKGDEAIEEFTRPFALILALCPLIICFRQGNC
jgi:hypothetical protein